MPLFLSDEEFELCSHDASLVADKADSFIRDLHRQLENVKAQAEQKYISLSSDFAKVESQNAQLISELAQVQSEKHQIHLKSIGKDGDVECLSVEVSELHKSKRHLLELVEQKHSEITQKNATIKTYLDKIVNLIYNGSLSLGEARLHDIQAEMARSRAALSRVAQVLFEIEEKAEVILDERGIWMENLLPAEITLEILSRLPAESVLHCRQVCKTWRTLLRHPHFAQMHLQQQLLQPDNLGILYECLKLGVHTSHLYYGEYDENDEQSYYKTLERINHPPIGAGDHVFSCNGLIGFPAFKNLDTFCIFNPVTREYINLPAVLNTDIRKKEIRNIVYRFGYLPSTNEYKVVVILYRCTQSSQRVGSVQVYTLGAGTGWRNKGEITDLESWECRCMNANGALYFLDSEELKIMAFDLADEEFHLLPSPPCLVHGQREDYNDFLSIRVLGGLLCLVHQRRKQSITIWSLKKNYCPTTYGVMKEQENKCFSWHKEVCMAHEGLGTNRSDVFAFTRKGEVLLLLGLGIGYDDIPHSILTRYDPKTTTFKESDYQMPFREAKLHMNSFVSLKALGEDAKIFHRLNRIT